MFISLLKASKLAKSGEKALKSADYNGAIIYWEKALSIFRRIKQSQGEAYILTMIGVSHAHLGDYKKALDYHQQALIIARRIKNSTEEARILLHIGNAYWYLGKYEEALRYYQPAREVYKRIKDIHGEGCAIGGIAIVYSDTDRYDEALSYYKMALELFKQTHDIQEVGHILNQIGLVHQNLCKYEEALDYLQQALNISRKIGDALGEEASLGNIAMVLQKIGKYEKALDYSNQSINIAKRIINIRGVKNSLHLRGNIHFHLKRYEKALEEYQQQLDIARKIDDLLGEENALTNVGATYNCLGEYEKALQYHKQALEISRRMKIAEEERRVLHNIGLVYTELEKYDEALKYYFQSIKIGEEIKDLEGKRLSYYQVGKIYYNKEDYQKAYDYFLNAIQTVKEQRKGIKKYELKERFGERRVDAYNMIVSTCTKLGQYDRAFSFLEQSKTQSLIELFSEKFEDNKPISLEKTRELIIDKETALIEFCSTDDELFVFIIIKNGQLSNNIIKIEDFNKYDINKIVNKWITQYYQDRAGWFDFADKILEELYEKIFMKLKPVIDDYGIRKLVFIPYSALQLLPLHAFWRRHGGEKKYLLDEYEEITYAPSAQVLRIAMQNRNSEKTSLFAIANPEKDLVYSELEVDYLSQYFSPLKSKILWHKKATLDRTIKTSPLYNFVHFSCHGFFDPINPIESSLLLADKELELRKVFTSVSLPNSYIVILSACETGLVGLTEADEYIGLPAGFLYSGTPTVISTLWVVNDLSTSLLMGRLYNLIFQGIEKGKALNESQKWLRDLTAREVVEFLEKWEKGKNAQNANKEGPLGLEENEKSEVITEILRKEKQKSKRLAPSCKPFSHPFYWAPFICSGTST